MSGGTSGVSSKTIIKMNNYMNIYSPYGTKVIFSAKGGYHNQIQEAIKTGLVVGSTYTVNCTKVDSFSSTVNLVEFPGKSFNTAMFFKE